MAAWNKPEHHLSLQRDADRAGRASGDCHRSTTDLQWSAQDWRDHRHTDPNFPHEEHWRTSFHHRVMSWPCLTNEENILCCAFAPVANHLLRAIDSCQIGRAHV